MSERTMAGGRVAGTVALVTGAARGIGRAQAVRLAQEGADIVAVDLCGPVSTHDGPHATSADLAETVRQVERLGRRIVAEAVDVRDVEALGAVVDHGVDALGGLDTVCATAGIAGSAAALEMSEDVWQTMLDVNLTGVFHTCKVAVPHLLRRGRGSIVLVSSIAGLRGLTGVGHYVAAKHGVVGLMRTLAKELADSGIRVNTIHPTNVDTPMIQHDRIRRKFRPDLEHPTREEFAEAAAAMNLLPIPWVEPEDIANATLFLASDEARYITAVALPVDAGAIHK